MEGSDEIMNYTLFLGTFPGLTEAMINREIEVILKFAQSASRTTSETCGESQ
jgi:hypothetical protein